ncbi:MAG: flagellar biosynthetic protein FliO [Lachnospiraceae bacterium]|nr:flagellar biosynthetic protein FliO [Lachnospiraceae bacterium]
MILAGMSDRAESVTQFLTVILVFVLVLGMTYLTTRFVGNYQKSRLANRNFEVIETYRITNGKYLQIVKIGEKIIVIGIGKNDISYICDLSPGDIRIDPDDRQQPAEAFKTFLEKAGRRIGKGGSDNEK